MYTFGLHSTNARGTLEPGEEILNHEILIIFLDVPFLVKLRTRALSYCSVSPEREGKSLPPAVLTSPSSQQLETSR